MSLQTETAGAILNLVGADGMLFKEALIDLRDDKDPYVDVKVAEGVDVAVEELKLVRNELGRSWVAVAKGSGDYSWYPF